MSAVGRASHPAGSPGRPDPQMIGEPATPPYVPDREVPPSSDAGPSRLLWVAATAAWLACLVHLGVRLSAPFWLDEFSTLWVIERGLGAVLERTPQIQGQSPLYYLLMVPVPGLLGEHEWALRLPSLLLVAAAAAFTFRCGVELGRPRAGLLAALLLATHPVVLMVARIARPNGLAVAAAALLLWGFLRARAGRPGGRALLICGAVTLFYAHYVMTLLVAGVAAAWLLPEGRGAYRGRQFACDAVLGVGLTVPGLLYLWQLLARLGEGATSWIAESFRWYTLPRPLATLAAIAALGLLASSRGRAPEWRLPAVILLVPVALVSCLALLGINVITDHHIAYTYVPAALLAGVALDGAWRDGGLRRPLGAAAVAVAVLHVVIGCLAADRHFQRFGHQDWPAAIAAIEAEQVQQPGPVCLRSGFWEQVRVISDPEWTARYGSVFLAPLRSPGRRLPPWHVLLLNYRWRDPGRPAYLERAVLPELARENAFYYLSSRFWTYGREFRAWVGATLPEFDARRLATSPGLEAWVFTRVEPAERDAPAATTPRDLPSRPMVVDHRRHAPAEPDGGADGAVLGVELGRVGDVQAGQRGRVSGNRVGEPDRADGLGVAAP